MFSNSEILEILNREDASRREMEELNAQPPKCRPHRDRQWIQAFQQWRDNKLRAQRMVMSNGQAALKTAWITGKGHCSAVSLGALKPIQLAEMKVPAVHHGRVLACRAVTEPRLLLGNEVIVEDPTGDIESAIFYNFHSDLHSGGGWLKSGIIMLIKEPWLRYNHKAHIGEPEKVMLRVDSPSDVIFVHETNRDLLSQMGALCWYREERLTFDDLKTEGNNAFGKDDFDAASAFYDRAMCLASSIDETNVINLNLAAAKLSLRHYYDAYSHAETALAGGANREKALFRLGRSAYGMREWQRAVEHFEAMLAEFPENEKAKAELDRAKARVLEATTGRYNLHKLSDESSGGRMPFFDVADYLGPVEVSDIPGKGKGVIATADLKAGTRLMVSKAYAMSVLKEARDANLMCINFLARENNSHRAVLDSSTSALCVIDVVQKLKQQPQTAGALYALYAGDEERERGESVKLPERVIDTGRIERICSANSFGSESTPKSSNGWTDVLGRAKEEAFSSTGLWLMPSFLNHSCLGNSYRVFYGDVMFVYALCDVKMGEELTHSYCNPTKPLRERELKLLQKWHFQCDCQLCKLDREDVEGEKKRGELLEEYEQMEKLMLNGRLPPSVALPMAKAVVEEMRLSYSGRTSLHTQLPHLLEMLATVYNLLGQHKKQVETMKAMVDCVGDSVLKYYWAPYPHLYYAQALLHLMNNARAAKRVANEAFELVKIHSGVDKRLFLKKNPEFAEFIK